jgi:hypothetical protein
VLVLFVVVCPVLRYIGGLLCLSGGGGGQCWRQHSTGVGRMMDEVNEEGGGNKGYIRSFPWRRGWLPGGVVLCCLR